MKLLAVAPALLLSGCQTIPSKDLPVFDLVQAKSAPDSFLAQYAGKRVRIAGYFFDPQFLPTCDAQTSGSGNDIRDTYVDLPYQGRKTFEAMINQRIVIEATVKKPKRFRYGGGDLYFQVEEYEQDFYLDDAKLISIDSAAPHCER